jgi:peptidoglycan/LPS O-acetylase OafA/YrhL
MDETRRGLRSMRKLGRLLMALGLGVGALVVVAIGGRVGVAGLPWLISVALAKLGLVASAVLMAGGAVTIRLASRRERRELGSG